MLTSSCNFIMLICAGIYIPYNISVRARTSAGYGPPSENITFTEEGSAIIESSTYLVYG